MFNRHRMEPMFPNEEKIIKEIGGLISHGAVVTRKYGLPALPGVESGVQLYKTGNQILLDCENGFVPKISSE